VLVTSTKHYWVVSAERRRFGWYPEFAQRARCHQ